MTTYKRQTGRAPLARILMRVEHAPCPVPDLEGPCWIWPGAERKGYGTLKVDGRLVYTHQVTYRELIDPNPEGEPDHLCKVKACCNPWHLLYGSHRDNTRTGQGGTVTHCPNGHERTTAGQRANRRCAECDREYHRRRRAARKQEST
jgi:hypothetical protein